jgi:transcriptional regulator with XRE-family HTH domain
VDISLVIKARLAELGLDQRDLAAAANVTDSYVSQLLTRKKAPPAPGRTDLYDRMGAFLKLPAGELQKLAEIQRREELKKRLVGPPRPLFGECRDLVVRKCDSRSRREVRRIFEKEPFGELERLVTQKLLDVAQGIAREELRNEEWIRRLASLSGRSYEQMRVAILEFLDTDVLSISVEGCASFLDPMIESWDIDLKTFAMEIMLNRRLTPASRKRFEFAEQASRNASVTEPGLVEFLEDKSLSSDATEEEIEFLRRLQFVGRWPTPLYYYRELQNLRDPLHFTDTAPPAKRRRSV